MEWGSGLKEKKNHHSRQTMQCSVGQNTIEVHRVQKSGSLIYYDNDTFVVCCSALDKQLLNWSEWQIFVVECNDDESSFFIFEWETIRCHGCCWCCCCGCRSSRNRNHNDKGNTGSPFEKVFRFSLKMPLWSVQCARQCSHQCLEQRGCAPHFNLCYAFSHYSLLSLSPALLPSDDGLPSTLSPSLTLPHSLSPRVRCAPVHFDEEHNLKSHCMSSVSVPVHVPVSVCHLFGLVYFSLFVLFQYLHRN